MATRGCQLQSRNVHLASPQPNATGHVEIAEQPSCRYSILDDSFILFDTVGNCSLRGPSPTSPFPSFALDQAHLPVWPSTRRLWPPPCSLLTVRSAWGEGASRWKAQLLEGAERQGSVWPQTSSCETWTWESRMPTTTDVWRLWPTVCDTALVSAIHGDGQPKGAADRDGVALKRARRRKETTFPELVQPGSRARLVVPALEVGSRWSQEVRTFVRYQVGAASDEAAHGTGVRLRSCTGLCSFPVGPPRRTWGGRSHAP